MDIYILTQDKSEIVSNNDRDGYMHEFLLPSKKRGKYFHIVHWSFNNFVGSAMYVHIPNECRIIMLSCNEISFVISFLDFEKF